MDKFNRIVDKIYAEDKQTPLFLNKADLELRKEDYNKAVDILNEGISYYPNFAPAYLLLGRALALIGSYDLAVENVKKGSSIINSKRTYEYYLEEIEKIKNEKQHSTSEETLAEAIIPVEKENSETEKKLEPRPLPVDNDIINLVQELAEEEKIFHNEKVAVKKISNENEIISETLAKIYVTQGELKEAIKIYRKLKDKHPEKIDYFNKRINELNVKYNS
jgi:tetratricopeptide (TPR) repeat protein